VIFHKRNGDIEGKVRDRDARLRVEVVFSLSVSHVPRVCVPRLMI
jgi:hypothetical protein